MQAGGVVILDEPEAALSAAAAVDSAGAAGRLRLLMTLPGVRLLEIGADGIVETRLEDTRHYQITRGILESPERYWKHLRAVAEQAPDGEL